MYTETTVIYADVLFIINFSLDYLCLFLTGRILNCGGKVWRLIFASFIGGVYAFVPYLVEPPTFASFTFNLGAAGLICLVAFGKQDLKRFFVISGTFVVSSALLGGLVTAFYSLGSGYSDGVYAEVDSLSFVFICLISALVALSYGLICRKKIYVRSAEIRIFAGEKKFDARLLADSGNLVTEPFSALPVIVITASALPFPFDSPESEMFPFPIRAIPYRTSSGKSCFFGFRPDRIEVRQIARKPRKIEAYIGIDTENKTYSGYDGLMPTSLL